MEADDGQVVGIEVKASATLEKRDFVGLESLREAADPASTVASSRTARAPGARGGWRIVAASDNVAE
jgi:hypothetical protein